MSWARSQFHLHGLEYKVLKHNPQALVIFQPDPPLQRNFRVPMNRTCTDGGGRGAIPSVYFGAREREEHEEQEQEKNDSAFRTG